MENRTPHCELCGRNNPDTSQGYTACCNELVCYQDFTDKWEAIDSGKTTIACCSFTANRQLNEPAFRIGRG